MIIKNIIFLFKGKKFSKRVEKKITWTLKLNSLVRRRFSDYAPPVGDF